MTSLSMWSTYIVLLGIFIAVVYHNDPGYWAGLFTVVGVFSVVVGVIDLLIEHRKYLRPRWKVESRGWDIKHPEIFVDWYGTNTFWTRRGAQTHARMLLRAMQDTSQRYRWETRAVNRLDPPA